MKFDVLIIGGGASGLSCALVLGSAKNKHFAREIRYRCASKKLALTFGTFQ